MDVVTYALLKKKIDGIGPSPYKYKGSVPTYDDLPESPDVGDMYSVADTGTSYVWDGTQWNEVKYGGTEIGEFAARKYSASGTYVTGDYVAYDEKIYKALVDISVAEVWNPEHWERIWITDELGGGGSDVEWSDVIADNYNPALTYALGSYVIYNNLLWKCRTAIGTPEEWTEAHWTTVKVGDELFALPDKATQTTLTLALANWTGSGPWTQTVTVSGYSVTTKTKADLIADATAMETLAGDSVDAIYISNNNGVLTATATGARPDHDLNVLITLTEVK